jgi:3-oxoacyl-[acyl-carrier protein] reductase
MASVTPESSTPSSDAHAASASTSASTSTSLSTSATTPWAIVTGGSRGLGFETARGLVASGYRVVLVAKDFDRLQEARTKINEEFVDKAEIFAIDLEATTPEALAEVQSKARELLEHFQVLWGAPKVLVLAHGVMSAKMSKTLRTDVDEWRRVMSINLDSVFALVNVFGTVMSEARDGRVIIYSACLGRMSGPGNAGGLAPYRISKAGVNALVRNLAHETGNGSRGFLIDAVCPNHSRTDMGGPDAPRSAEEGAACAIWLATRPFTPGVDQTGLLWEDNAVVPW